MSKLLPPQEHFPKKDWIQYARDVADERDTIKALVEKTHLFNDVFIKRFFQYSRHRHDCTFDNSFKGDVCTCGFQGLINLYYEIKDAL